MTDVMHGLVLEAKKNKYSGIGPSLSEEDVVSVWDSVSQFIEKQMSQQKGVNITGLGIFTFTQKKLDVGNNKFILIQRPVFLLSEKFAQTHGLEYTKHHVTGQIPVVQLNFAALSMDTPFDRDTVEACVKEVLGALARSVGARKNVQFTLNTIGRLQVRDNKVKMKFYKEFVNSMDGSGRAVEAMKDRPGTVDSVISARTPSRAASNMLFLPRISQSTGGLNVDGEGQTAGAAMPPIQESAEDNPAEECANLDAEFNAAMAKLDPETAEMAGDGQMIMEDREGMEEGEEHVCPAAELGPTGDMEVGDEVERKQTSRMGSRQSVPLAKATGVNFVDEILASARASVASGMSIPKSSPTPMIMKRSLSPIQSGGSPRLSPLSDKPEFTRAKSVDQINLRKPTPLLGKVPTPPATAQSVCTHTNAGQELCYLCHQRERRNIPVSFAEERRRRDEEEDKLLQQYQHMKDSEAMLEEQEQLLAKRHENQKMAAFNLGVAEGIKTKKLERPTDFRPSYIFQKRPLTPPRFIKQEQLHKDLATQVNANEASRKKQKSDEEFLERLEQVQLAEDLAAQREQYLKDKRDQHEQYKRALSTQLRFKPMQVPESVPDSSEPVFGQNDMNQQKAAEQRRRAHEVYKEQLGTVEQRKREAILRRLQEQKEEEDMLKRTKEELLEDRAKRYERMFCNRKHLEDDWAQAAYLKKKRDDQDRTHMRSGAMLLHEQCDKYKRCHQCKRQLVNCGESNIWRESRYIPGSRLMV